MNQNLDQLMVAANRFHAEGRFEESAEACQEILKVLPFNVPALVLLGIGLFKKGDLQGSVVAFQRAVQADPKCGPGYLWLSIAYRSLGQSELALQQARKSVDLNPTDPVGLNHLGQCYLDRGEFGLAEATLKKALSLAPNVALIHHSHGLALQGLNRRPESVSAFRRAAQLDPKSLPTLSMLRQMLMEDLDLPGAAEFARAMVELQTSSVEAMLWLSRVLAQDGKGEEADIYFERAADLEPQGATEFALLGSAYQVRGRIEEAERYFRASLELSPNQSAAYFAIANNRRLTEDDRAAIVKMEQLASDSGPPGIDKEQLHYALGKALEDVGEYEASMAHLDKANRMAYLAKYGRQVFDRQAFHDGTDRTIKTFTSELLRVEKTGEALPIFVVGMIRSGTTLVEQILSSHPDIGAAGEQSFWLENGAFAINANGRIDSTALQRMARKYEKRLREIAPDKAHVVDKMPMNFMMIGLIHLAFPAAKIVHVRRNPIDTCISIYATPNSARIGWAHNKGNIVFAYQEYLRLMEHWRNALPRGVMLEVTYEELVSEQERVTREMVDFCNLQWNDACLQPERNERKVVTPSVWQVRQPVYKTAVARWKKFEPWLGEFRQLRSSEKPVE